MEQNPYKAPVEGEQVERPIQAPLFMRRPFVFMYLVCGPCVVIGGIAGMWLANHMSGPPYDMLAPVQEMPAKNLAVQMGWGLGAMAAGVPAIAYGFWQQYVWRKAHPESKPKKTPRRFKPPA